MQSEIGRILRSVEEQGSDMLILTFNQRVTKVEIIPKKRNCRLRNGSIEMRTQFCGELGLEFVDIVPNPFGFADDATVSKDRFQIGIGELSMKPSFSSTGTLNINTEIEGLIEASSEMTPQIRGNIDLIVNPSENGYVDYSRWSASMVSIATNHSTPGFFNVDSEISGDITGRIEVEEPFAILNSEFTGIMQPFDMLDNWPVPEDVYVAPTFELTMTTPALEGIDELTCDDIPSVLSRSLDILIGPSSSDQTSTDALRSCSGGVLGSEINGVRIFQYKIPGIDMTLCDIAQHLIPLVEGIEQIEQEHEEGQCATLTYIEEKITNLLTSTVGGTPDVSLTPSENEVHTNLDLTITLNYIQSRSAIANIDLEEYLASSNLDESTAATVALFTSGLEPIGSGAEIEVDTDLTLHLAIGIEYEKNDRTTSLYMKDNTGIVATFLSDASFGFQAQIGALEGTVEGTAKVGEPNSPLTFTAGFSDAVGESENNQATKMYLSGPNARTIASILNDATYDFTGSLDLFLDAQMGEIFFPITEEYSPPGLEVTSAVDMRKLLFGEEDAFSNTVIATGSFSPELPSLFDILIMNPEGVIQTIDQIFERVETATVGEEGIITLFAAPFIGEKLGNALGAGTEDNAVRRIRNAIIPAAQETLDTVSEEDKIDIASLIANGIQSSLSDINLLYPEREVSVLCYDTERNMIDCTDENAASYTWTVPIGQEFEVPMDLNFDIDSTDFPF